jgi:hypothetical protein
VTTAQEREDQVRAVLKDAIHPMAPQQIARIICKEWCCYGGKASGATSAPVSVVLKRIGAVAVKRGLWILPTEDAK